VPHPELQADEIFALLWEREHRHAGARFDATQRLVDGLGRLGGHDEPHVERMLARIVVRNLRERVHRRRRVLEQFWRHAHRGEREGAAHALDLEQRPEARERAIVQQAIDGRDEVVLGRAERARRVEVRPLAHRKAGLQPVDDRAIELIHRSSRREDVRRSA
jgi:hypothetical protein